MYRKVSQKGTGSTSACTGGVCFDSGAQASASEGGGGNQVPRKGAETTSVCTAGGQSNWEIKSQNELWAVSDAEDGPGILRSEIQKGEKSSNALEGCRDATGR